MTLAETEPAQADGLGSDPGLNQLKRKVVNEIARRRMLSGRSQVPQSARMDYDESNQIHCDLSKSISMTDTLPPDSPLFAELSRHPSGNTQSIDRAHVFLIAGLILAHKPRRVLELGVGSAYLTRVVLAALRENACGELTSVDNFYDWSGAQPPHIAVLQRESPSWKLVLSDETGFLREASSEAFDFVISDGDHTRGYQNTPDTFRVCAPGGVIVFHDTNSVLFRLLGRVPARCRQLGFPGMHFTAQSLPGERTERGLFVVAKDRPRRFTLDPQARLYLLWRDRLRPLLRREAKTKSRRGSVNAS